MIDFIGIGAQKAGTTWLFKNLSRHPNISFPGGKEVHFWDKYHSNGTDWYSKLFEKPDGRLHGDITPAYACLEPEKIAECHQLFPHLKLIYTLRNPMDRAWSHAKMELQRTGRNLADVPDEWFLDHFISDDSLSRGNYEKCIRNWLQFYSIDQLLIVYFEEIVEDPSSFLGKCCEHLEIIDIYQPDNELVKQIVRKGIDCSIRPTLRAALLKIYSAKVLSLSNLLHKDLAFWLK